MSLTPHYQHLWKKLYRFGQRRRKALSAATQRNTLRDQSPKGQLWLWAMLCYGILYVYIVLKPVMETKYIYSGTVLKCIFQLLLLHRIFQFYATAYVLLLR